MKILVDSRNLNSHGIKAVKKLGRAMLTRMAKEVDVSLHAIGDVIISDPEKYLSSIQKFEENGSYSNYHTHVGVGKALVYKDNGQTKNAIIFRDNLFAAALAAEKTYNTSGNLTHDMLQGWYIPYHELGHCKDNVERKIETNLMKPEEFSLANSELYNIEMIISEFAACFFSGRKMSISVYQEMESLAVDLIEEALDKGEQLKRQYSSDQSVLFELGSLILGHTWTLLVNYSKLIGSRLSNPSLKALPLRFWKQVSPESKAAITEFESLLESSWSKYPKWEEELYAQIPPLWEKLTMSHGYCFKDRDGNMALYWN